MEIVLAGRVRLYARQIFGAGRGGQSQLSGRGLPWIKTKSRDQFRDRGFGDPFAGFFRRQPLAVVLTFFRPALLGFHHIQRKHMDRATPGQPARRCFAIKIAAQGRGGGPAANAGFFKRLPFRARGKRLARFRPVLGKYPAPRRPACHQQDFRSLVSHSPRQRRRLNMRGRTAEHAARPFNQMISRSRVDQLQCALPSIRSVYGLRT